MRDVVVLLAILLNVACAEQLSNDVRFMGPSPLHVAAVQTLEHSHPQLVKCRPTESAGRLDCWFAEEWDLRPIVTRCVHDTFTWTNTLRSQRVAGYATDNDIDFTGKFSPGYWVCAFTAAQQPVTAIVEFAMADGPDDAIGGSNGSGGSGGNDSGGGPGNGGGDGSHPPGQGGEEPRDGRECRNGGSGDHNADGHPDCGLGRNGR